MEQLKVGTCVIVFSRSRQSLQQITFVVHYLWGSKVPEEGMGFYWSSPIYHMPVLVILFIHKVLYISSYSSALNLYPFFFFLVLSVFPLSLSVSLSLFLSLSLSLSRSLSLTHIHKHSASLLLHIYGYHNRICFWHLGLAYVNYR